VFDLPEGITTRLFGREHGADVVVRDIAEPLEKRS
jgi:hypothetical protein